MTPKADPAAALLDARTAREQQWAYELWLERRSFGQIRAIANLPPSEGGLGYDLSEQAIKGLVRGARESRGDLTLTREERIERQGAEVDERARAARHDYAAAYTRLAKLDTAIAAWDMDNYVDPVTALNALALLTKQRESVAGELDRIDARLDRTHQREAKLFGLDQPTELNVQTTNDQALTAELNDMLERAGHKPIEVEQ